jgi:hypothetical protein
LQASLVGRHQHVEVLLVRAECAGLLAERRVRELIVALTLIEESYASVTLSLPKIWLAASTQLKEYKGCPHH